MTDDIRFGIIGCGGIGTFHAEILQSVPHARLVAVMDILPERAQQVSARFGVAGYDAYPEMLARTDLDVVTVCTPSGLHAEHGMQAARAGKHVLCEKPMDIFVERIDDLVATCRTAGVVLGGIFQNRFPIALQQTKRAIVDGWLGDIIFANGSCLWYRTQEYYDSGAWRGTWTLDGGTLSNQGIHTIDRLVWLTGMTPTVRAAYCPTLCRDMEAEDLGIALLTFPNGAGGVLQSTTLANPGIATNVTICGTKGTVVVEDNAVTYFQAEGAPDNLVTVERPGSTGGAADPAAAWGGAHAANIEEFVAALRENREPSVNAQEARKAVQVLNDIYRVAQLGPWAV